MNETQKTTVYDIIKKLRETSSINDKIDILKNNQEVPYFQQVLKYAYDPTYVFYIKKFNSKPESINIKEAPEFPLNPKDPNNQLEIMFQLLDTLRQREVTGNKAKDLVSVMASVFDENFSNLLELILKKDLKCGINKKLIQKVFPDLIPEIGYMGAVPYDEKKLDKLIKNENIIFSQEKMDGEYSNAVIISDKSGKVQEIQFVSRNSKPQTLPMVLHYKIMKIFNEDESLRELFDLQNREKIVLNGELLIDGFDRYTSNGLLSSIITVEKKLAEGKSKEDKDIQKSIQKIEEIAGMSYNNLCHKIYYVIWDYINQIPDYFIRFFQILNLNMHDGLSVVDTTIIVKDEDIFSNTDKMSKLSSHPNISYAFLNSKMISENTLNEKIKEELFNHFQSIISKGGEGTIVKSGSGKWKNGKPTYQIKMKFEFECEMRIVDFKQGKEGTKYENSLGAFICESEDGIVKCDSSGISEDIRDEVWNNKEEYQGKIITVKCNGLSQDKEENYSLLHPRFIKFRDDKDTADSFEEIQEIHNSIQQGEKGNE